MNKLSAKISPSSGPQPVTLHLPTPGNVFQLFIYSSLLVLSSCYENVIVEVGRSGIYNTSDVLSLFFLASEKDPQEQPLVQDERDAERPSKRCCVRCRFRAVRKVTCGLILGACVAVSWAWGTNSAKETLKRHPAPFFIIWFCSIWNILFFPLYYLCHLLTEKQKQLPTTEFRLVLFTLIKIKVIYWTVPWRIFPLHIALHIKKYDSFKNWSLKGSLENSKWFFCDIAVKTPFCTFDF